MEHVIDKSLINTIFGKERIEEVSLLEVDEKIAQYPYFHFLYLLKMIKTEDISEVSRLALHTPNILLSYTRSQIRKEMMDDPEKDRNQAYLLHSAVEMTDVHQKEVEVEQNTTEPHSLEPLPNTTAEEDVHVPSIVQETPQTQSDPLPAEPIEPDPPKKEQDTKTGEDQLKTFFDWLGVMNRLSLDDKQKSMIISEDVIKDSALSIHEHEIITESMAEVWVLQGQYQRGIDIYKKLILLFPDKSTYFADRINKVKSDFGI